ncbi:MAG TPA: type I methionyl aminopeptidase [Planctomycetota bacterium]|nr:type I methionyl aminopeptidase [Planctomycetota bacterium]
MIKLKSRREIDIIRRAGRIVAEALTLCENVAQPGLTTEEIDRRVAQLIVDRGGVPAFLGYRGFPKNCCISINEQLVHGIPGPRRLEAGDLVSVDIGVKLESYYADAAVSFGVGRVPKEAEKLMSVTRKSLDEAIAVLKDGVRLSDIGRTIQRYVERHGFSVVRQFVGHGIGRELWEEPQVPNFWDDGATTPADRTLRTGAVIAIEPMVNAGGYSVKTLADRWTVVTADDRLCAHYEHTLAVTDEGCEILTAP